MPKLNNTPEISSSSEDMEDIDIDVMTDVTDDSVGSDYTVCTDDCLDDDDVSLEDISDDELEELLEEAGSLGYGYRCD